MRGFWVAAVLFVGGSSVSGQMPASPAGKSTLDGVYTAAQAARGQNTFAFNCQGCHTPASYTGEQFTKHWVGKPLTELYGFISTMMPKSEPGSLSEGEYAQLVAYLLKLNQMPAGSVELPADTLVLKRIQFTSKSR